MAKLDIKALGLSFGIVWAMAIFLSGICSLFFNWCTGIVIVFSSIYIGYSATVVGSLIGAAWAFVDGAIFGIVVAWLYNKFAQ